MDSNYQQLLARALLGNGMAGQAADISKLQPIHQQLKTEANMQGLPFPEFNEWLKSQNQGNPQ